MKSGKGLHDEEEDEDEEFGTKKDATPSTATARDGKNSDKANAVRSKHSVTEQRRRSKINERFQILRDLIPHGEQKRDTASFLLDVIHYVQFLQEKLQKYEGSFQSWNSEPTKLMPWRNSHWRVQNYAGQPQVLKNGSGPGSTFPGRFDDNSIAVPTTIQAGQQNPVESDALRDIPCRSLDLHPELQNKGTGMPVPRQAGMPVSVANDGGYSPALPIPASDAQFSESPSGEALNHQDDLTIEGGTISISSVYSQGLLNSLSQALKSTGVDLSQASISVQINLGKRANRGSAPGMSRAKDHVVSVPSGSQPVGPFRDTSSVEDLDPAQKRLKI